MTLPLEGVKVLDLSRLAPGPFCTMVLGDLGSDVLKVEGPREGKLVPMGRGIPVDEEREAVHNSLERNKRSIVLNLKSEEARQIFYQLVKSADVIVEGFRPGAVKRLKVDYDTVREINPRIIYCSITGYGQDGPYHNMVGHDINYISIGGALGIIGIPGGAPIIPANLIADFAAGGMNSSIGILAALMARDKTGKGQYVDMGLGDGVVSLMAQSLSRYFSSGTVPERGNAMSDAADRILHMAHDWKSWGDYVEDVHAVARQVRELEARDISLTKTWRMWQNRAEETQARLDRMRRAFKRLAWVQSMLSWAFADRRFVTALRRVARQQVGAQP